MFKKRKTIRIEFPEEWGTFQHHPGPSEAVVSQKRSENSIFHGFQTQARSHEPIFGDRTLIFGVNVTHWWGIENQNFGGDPMTLPFLRFLRKPMLVTLVLPLCPPSSTDPIVTQGCDIWVSIGGGRDQYLGFQTS